MSPIVDGLKVLYDDEVAFVALDANGVGRDAYAAAGAPGHPAFLIVGPDGTEFWRGFGIFTLNELDNATSLAIEQAR